MRRWKRKPILLILQRQHPGVVTTRPAVWYDWPIVLWNAAAITLEPFHSHFLSPVLEQLRHSCLQCQGDPDEISERRIPARRLYAAEVCSVDSGLFSQPFLGPPFRIPQFPNADC